MSTCKSIPFKAADGVNLDISDSIDLTMSVLAKLTSSPFVSTFRKSSSSLTSLSIRLALSEIMDRLALLGSPFFMSFIISSNGIIIRLSGVRSSCVMFVKNSILALYNSFSFCSSKSLSCSSFLFLILSEILLYTRYATAMARSR